MSRTNETNLSTVAELRRQAEERLQVKSLEIPLPRTPEEALRLVHELEVHQIELELQNEELRLASEGVMEVLDKYTDLYDFAPVGYFTLDRNGAIRAVNLNGARLLGVERGRLLGQRFGLFVCDDARPVFADFLGKVFASQDRETCELSILNGGHCPVHLQIEAVVIDSGHECRFAVMDVTTRCLAEEALARKRRQLEELNASLNERIEQALIELRQKDQLLILQDRLAAMGEMINNIAHQWRQPLNTLGLVIQQLPLFYDTTKFDRAFLEENTAKSMELIQHMAQTIDDFRNFFSVDKKAMTFSLNQVVGKTLSLIEQGFQDVQIQIDWQPEGEPMAHGYPNEYAQVLLNILLNARDALVGNSVADARISLHAFSEGDKTVVTITDNAGGVPVEIIDRLFDPYFTTKGPDQGTGIGLFMSKTIIEKNMNGRLTVRNHDGGAEFRIEV